MRPCVLDDGHLVGNEGGLALPSWSAWSAPRAGVIKHMNTQRPSDMAIDLMLMQRSCSSFRVLVKQVSPDRAEAMTPALHIRKSIRVDLAWSTWVMTAMFLMLAFLSVMGRIWFTGPGREAALAWASLAQRFPASSVLARC